MLTDQKVSLKKVNWKLEKNIKELKGTIEHKNIEIDSLQTQLQETNELLEPFEQVKE